jgi:hypothetical protein
VCPITRRCSAQGRTRRYIRRRRGFSSASLWLSTSDHDARRLIEVGQISVVRRAGGP